ncbi:MAG: Gfo/Idh/MocA family oxidoreductase [Armatimonadaceae bacterium]
MAETELKVGIVGAGHIAAVHARHLARVSGVRLVAVADTHRERAEVLATSYGAASYEGADPMLRDQAVDAVVVCVPTESHAEITEAALAAGKHVLCEKPMALTVADCDRMIAAQKAESVLAVGQVVRFFPEYANAKRLVESGAVGAPAAVRLRRNVSGKHSSKDWYSDPKRGGGVIFDLLVHELDWLLWCFGPISRVYAHSLTRKLAEGTSPGDYALLTLRHANGVIAHVEGYWGDPNGFSTAFEIAGDAGLLTHDSRRAASLVRSRRDGGSPVVASPLFPQEDPYYRQLAAFVETIQTGTMTAVSAEAGRATVAVAEAAVQSAQSGAAVALEV